MFHALVVLSNNLHFIYANSEQLFVEVLKEHCNKLFVKPKIHPILPENISSFVSDEGALDESLPPLPP